jgi:hypothetical protein
VASYVASFFGRQRKSRALHFSGVLAVPRRVAGTESALWRHDTNSHLAGWDRKGYASAEYGIRDRAKLRAASWLRIWKGSIQADERTNRLIRDMELKDVETLEAIHKQSGFDYLFPLLDDPLFVVKKVSEVDGRVVQGIAAKIEVTMYLWLSHVDGTPEERWQWLQDLVEETKHAAWLKGLDTITCVVPPEIADSFEKRLKAIGMERDRPWPKFSFDLQSYVPRVESEVQAT